MANNTLPIPKNATNSHSNPAMRHPAITGTQLRFAPTMRVQTPRPLLCGEGRRQYGSGGWNKSQATTRSASLIALVAWARCTAPRLQAQPRCRDQSSPLAFARDPERLARFKREAKLLASLNHPNIAAIYGLEEAPTGIHFLVLELSSRRSRPEHLPSETARLRTPW